MDNTAR